MKPPIKSLMLAAVLLSGCSSPFAAIGELAPAPPETPAVDDGGLFGLEEVPVGTPYEWVEDDGTAWTVTLNEAECGMDSIDGAADNPAYYEGDYSADMTMALEPRDGFRLCQALWTWENTGNTPGMLSGGGAALVGDEQHSRDADDEGLHSYNLSMELFETEISEDVNPGETVQTADVYQIPEDGELDGIFFPISWKTAQPLVIMLT